MTRWKRINYLTHRWVGIGLGGLMLAWFASGIVMMYYPYPVLTESEKLALLEPFDPSVELVGFRRAHDAARRDLRERGHSLIADPDRATIGGRLLLWNGRPAYSLWHQREHRVKAYVLVDALTAEVLSPLSRDEAVGATGRAAPPGATVDEVDLLARGDHYMFWGSYHLEEFPVYRVRFDDPRATSVYVGQEPGLVYATADRTTRVLTWLGTVPHWLYFMWLYERPGLWTWLNLALPAVACVIALTGMALGSYQLFPRRRRGEWRISAYHGVSKWHHLAGVVFGLLVFTWTLSGVLEMLGASNDPLVGQAQAIRGGPFQWDRLVLGEAAALERVRQATGAGAPAVAVDLAQILGRPGYHVLLADGQELWVDAEDGRVRAELEPDEVREAAARIAGPDISLASVERIDGYDAYYYHRHGREMHLPAWRVTLGDAERSTLYLDTVTGTPTGFVTADTRLWRWLRDGMHSLDFPTLIERRPLWDLLVLPLMAGGLLSAATGGWLLVRRIGRIAHRRRTLNHGPDE